MAQPPSSELEALGNPSSVSLSSFPPHRRRPLKSDTLSTFLQLLSHSYCPKPAADADNNEVERATEVRVETEINEAQHINEDRIETNEVDLRSRINKELVLRKGKGCNELEQTTVCGVADATTNIESEMLSTKGDDASFSKVIYVSESIHEDRMETNELDSENRTNKELRKETSFGNLNSLENTSFGMIDGSRNSLVDGAKKDSSCSELEQTTNAAGTTNIESEILPTNGDDASCLKVVNDSIRKDKAETGGFDSETITNIELGQETGFKIKSSLEEINPESNVALLTPVDEQQNSLVRSLLKDSEIVQQVDIDMDETAKSPILGSSKEVRSLIVENSELNQGNLEESLMNSLLCVALDDEIEEGEVLGDFVIDDEMIDFIFEEQTSEPIVNKEHKSDQNHKGTSEAKNKLDKNVEVVVNEVGKGSETISKPKPDWESVMKYQGDLSADKDPGGNKKRKRGPMTQEKRAKKKKKERIKRAEKNKQLGVKRLKIQPVVMKPKPVEHCRHYLKGRCQEGDKCKFSHDTTPLTKSKPCGHFARNSCMKGDDCPYDHQLSKYPCNNFVTKGYCGRGTDCMFSHKVQRAEGSPKRVNASSSEAKDTSLSWVTNSEKKTSAQKSSIQKVDPNTSSVAKSSFISAQQKIAEIKLRAAATEPKGISKILFGKLSTGNETKPSSRTDDNAKVNLPVVKSTENTVSNLNGTSKVKAHMEPKGVNFLSFSKSPTKQANHTGESEVDLVSNLNETPKRDPSMPPRGINFLSFSKAAVNTSSNMMIAQPNADNAASSSAHETERAPNSALKALLSNGSSSAHKALESTLAFAAKYESRIKIDHPFGSLNTSNGSTGFGII